MKVFSWERGNFPAQVCATCLSLHSEHPRLEQNLTQCRTLLDSLGMRDGDKDGIREGGMDVH